MSTKLALAKLCACVCGGAIIGGGAVQVKQAPPKSGYHKTVKKKVHYKKIAHVVKKSRVKRMKYAATCVPNMHTYFIPMNASITTQELNDFSSSGNYTIIGGSSGSGGAGSSSFGGSSGFSSTSSGGGSSTSSGTSSSTSSGGTSTSSSSSSSSSSFGGTSSSSSGSSGSTGFSTSSSSGGTSSSTGGTDIPEPPMVILFGFAAMFLFGRKFI